MQQFQKLVHRFFKHTLYNDLQACASFSQAPDTNTKIFAFPGSKCIEFIKVVTRPLQECNTCILNSDRHKSEDVKVKLLSALTSARRQTGKGQTQQIQT